MAKSLTRIGLRGRRFEADMYPDFLKEKMMPEEITKEMVKQEMIEYCNQYSNPNQIDRLARAQEFFLQKIADLQNQINGLVARTN